MKVATAMISRSALRHNLQQLKTMAGASQIMTVVKGNAYGHGALEVAHTLAEQSDSFGVARLSEALELRHSGIQDPIVLLEGFFFADDLPQLVEYNLQSVVHSYEQLEALEQTKLDKPIVVWMKLDTGMHRLGVRLEDAEDFYQRLLNCPNVVKPVNLMTHFYRSDETLVNVTNEQIARFDHFVAGKPGLQSISASAGILAWPNSYRHFLRPGLALYGISPLPQYEASNFNLRPVMTLKSVLIAVRKHKAGEAVGYGGMWISPRDTRLGVVAMGYADGYPRILPEGTPVWVNGRLVPIVGRVSMDMLVVDLGPQATDRVADEVVLWGDVLPIERVAAHSGISPYELVTRLTLRVALEFHD